MDYRVKNINELRDVLKTVISVRKVLPSEIQDIDLMDLIYEIYGIPETVMRSRATSWVVSRALLEEGASYGEAARSASVDKRTVRKWFPDRGWEPGGQSSAFLRKGDIEVERAVGAW